MSIRLAVIPARGGSKRIPRKNIKSFCGKPIIVWSIEVAINSGCFDRIIVSTDDEEIKRIATRAGADVPFMRPAQLSDDFTGTGPVVRHAIESIREDIQRPELVCCIYATAPFIRPDDLRKGLELLVELNVDYAFSVTSYAFPIQRALRINTKNRVEMFSSEHWSMRSQDIESAYHDAGQFYWGSAGAWCAEKPIFTSDSVPVYLPRYRVQDIDTLEDWTRAEWLFHAMQKRL